MEANEALARAWLRADGSDISDTDVLTPYHAAHGGKLSSLLKAMGFAVVPLVPTPEMLASVLPRTSDGDAIDYDLAECACKILGLSLPSGEVAAVDLSRDYRALVAYCK